MKLWQHNETGRLHWAEQYPSSQWQEVELCCEDDLPADMTSDLYRIWFDISRVVDGVRVGPVLCKTDQYYLETKPRST